MRFYHPALNGGHIQATPAELAELLSNEVFGNGEVHLDDPGDSDVGAEEPVPVVVGFEAETTAVRLQHGLKKHWADAHAYQRRHNCSIEDARTAVKLREQRRKEKMRKARKFPAK